MTRTLCLLLLLTACNKATPTPSTAAVAPDPSDRVKTSAVPATVTLSPAGDRSALIVVFHGSAPDASIQVWGTQGLVLPKTEVWRGAPVNGVTRTAILEHTGAGDLAVQIEGSFEGERASMVRSFTVGTRASTPVPERTVAGEQVKGWDATAE